MNNSNTPNVGLFFGSFNPVHIGHLALANYIVENSYLDVIWFVVSPQNPFKAEEELISIKDRVEMIKFAIRNYDKFKISTIELTLDTPSYTYKTLRALSKQHPDLCFTLIIGTDNLEHISRWKEPDEIVNNYKILVYPRPGYKITASTLHKNIQIIEAPTFDISSSMIREGIKKGKDYQFLIPSEIVEFIDKHAFYK